MLRLTAVLFLSSLVLTIGCGVNADSGFLSPGCNNEKNFSVGPQGGTFNYNNWQFVVPAGTVSADTPITLENCPNIQLPHHAPILVQDKQTGKVEVEDIPLPAAEGFETVQLQIGQPGNVVNAEAFEMCPIGLSAAATQALLITTKIGDSIQWAAPNLATTPASKCVHMFGNNSEVAAVVQIGAADGTWSNIWNKISSYSAALYDKLAAATAVATDSCGLCAYVSGQLGNQVTCAGLSSSTMCAAVTAVSATVNPLLLLPGVKQSLCFIAGKTIDVLLKTFSGSDLTGLCNTLSNNGSNAFKDFIGCESFLSCHYVGLCTSSDEQLDYVKQMNSTCAILCGKIANGTSSYQPLFGSRCCANPESCYQ